MWLAARRRAALLVDEEQPFLVAASKTKPEAWASVRLPRCRHDRRFWIGATLGCAFVTWIFIGESALNHAGTISLVLGVFAAAGCIASIYRSITLPVAFSIGEGGLELGRGKRFVPWDNVAEIRVSHHQSGHSLILMLKSSTGVGPRKFITTNAIALDELELGLDHMSFDWQRVVSG